MTRSLPILAGVMACMSAFGAEAAGQRVTVTGEVVDTWCSASQIMGYAYGTGHFQCAVWCATGGIPVGIKTESGQHYVLLKLGDDTESAAGARFVDFQARQVTVEGDVHERDGVSYLLIDQVRADGGIVNLSHKDYGIIPFGE